MNAMAPPSLAADEKDTILGHRYNSHWQHLSPVKFELELAVLKFENASGTFKLSLLIN